MICSRTSPARHLIIVEDILDSGNTLAFLKDYFMTKGAASITIVTLLDKPSRRTKAITADLAGFVVPDEFVVGYGLDYCQQYRNVPYIGVLKPEVYPSSRYALGRTATRKRPLRRQGKEALFVTKQIQAVQSQLCPAGLVILLCVSWLWQSERSGGPAGTTPRSASCSSRRRWRASALTAAAH